ncbi:MAG: YceI family protein [Gammaproteobacteria bacterium]|jgi:hypothetical protein|nr:YceI family protein [Gammaproteobacteria bacterium]
MEIKGHRRLAACLALVLTCFASTASAQWKLDGERSRLSFISVKNAAVGESHTFKSLVGFVNAGGSAQVGIDLNSVDTAIPIRDERMRELLFETGSYPSANITTEVDPAVMQHARAAPTVTTVSLLVELHGKSATYDATVVVSAGEDGSLHVATREPIVLDVGDFDLGTGVTALRTVAGLASISTSVPVSAYLVFKPD